MRAITRPAGRSDAACNTRSTRASYVPLAAAVPPACHRSGRVDPSADEVLEQCQTCAVGDWAFTMNSLFGNELPLDKSNAFTVGGFEVNEWLLWEKPDSTWSWLLKPLPGGKTRLIVRIRAHPRSLFWALSWSSATPPMARRMLTGIKSRAEKEPE